MVKQSWLTDAELEAVQHLKRDTPYIIRSVSQGYFSIARYYGGAKYNGDSYTYVPSTDELVRDDVMKTVKKMRRPAKSSATERSGLARPEKRAGK